MSNISDKYTFVENKDKTWQAIGLTKEAGKYQGVVYNMVKYHLQKKKMQMVIYHYDLNGILLIPMDYQKN